jgi:hypothetical protein
VKQVWQFLRQKSNREILAWIGAGMGVIAAGGWTIFAYAFPPNKEDGRTPRTEARCGGVAVGGNVTGVTITAGVTTNSNCSNKEKIE